MEMGHLAASNDKKIPHTTPTILPTRIRRCTGTTVKLSKDTAGHSFQPFFIRGKVSYDSGQQVVRNKERLTYPAYLSLYGRPIFPLERREGGDKDDSIDNSS